MHVGHVCMLGHGWNPGLRWLQERTSALHEACVKGNVAVVAVLVRGGAKLDARNKRVSEPVRKACSW